MLSTIVQVGGPAVALLLVHLVGFRILLHGAEKTNQAALKSARDQIENTSAELKRLRELDQRQQRELESARRRLSSAELAALRLEARGARLEHELTLLSAELKAERQRSDEYLRTAYGLFARNTRLEQSRDSAVSRGLDPKTD